MIRSMTGFAAGQGAFGAFEWTWDIRSVNGRGLDIKLRAPDWVPGLEAALRKAVSGQVHRGNVTISLRLNKEAGAAEIALDPVQLDVILDALTQIEDAAMERGLTLGPSNAADLLAQRGVLETVREEVDTAPLGAALIADFAPVLESFLEMRAREGAALQEVLTGQVDKIEALSSQAAAAAEARRKPAEEAFRTALARVLNTAAGADPDRVAQELAMLALKADVTEEIDRLAAHVGAARALLTSGEAVGRKLDFLTQEFNREANTLCAKSQNAALTRIGLDLKAVIDQLREQVQNVE